jgi:hypothetical protein
MRGADAWSGKGASQETKPSDDGREGMESLERGGGCGDGGNIMPTKLI